MKELERLREAVYQALDARDWAAARTAIAALAPLVPTEAAGLLVSSWIESGDLDAAETALEKLQRLAPQVPYTQFLTARILFGRKRYVTARCILEQALGRGGIAPAYLEKLENLLGQCCRELGDSRASTAAYLAAAEAAPTPSLGALEYSSYLFNRHYLSPEAPEVERQAAARYEAFFRDVPQHRWDAAEMRARQRAHGPKLRVGYISPDFREHVVLCFSWALVTGLDPSQFETVCYMTGPEDAYSRALAREVDGWRNLAGVSPDAAAAAIEDDEIDILVDLSGHTRGGALPVLARRPAPVQLSGIGYFASTGLSAVDGFLGDPYLDAGDAQKAFVEPLIVLPQSHFCYRPLHDVPVAAELPCQKNGFITFGSFNNFTKVNDDVLACWKALLDRVPESRLLLKASIFDAQEGREAALARLRAAGFDLSRIICRATSRDYLQEYHDMDIALDSFPYPGGGTSCDALYMGVPLVTLRGMDHGSRFGWSLLANLGLEELCADTPATYIDCAAALAEDKETLEALHRILRPMMQRSPLMNAASYAQGIMEAYRMVWQKKSQE